MKAHVGATTASDLEHHSSVTDFAELSAVLTGFSVPELYGTGMVEAHYNTVLGIIGERIFGRLLLTWHEIREKTTDLSKQERAVEKKILKGHAMRGPVARNIIAMWYVGNWNQLPREWREKYGATAGDVTHVVSAQAYQEGLAWRTFDAHPPTAKQMGFGSWTRPPGGAEEIDDTWRPRS